MKTKLLVGLGLAIAALVAMTPVPVAAGQLFPVMAFSFSPDYYSAEWAPWDSSYWAVPWYRSWYGLYCWSLWEDTERAQAWMNRHGHHEDVLAPKLVLTKHASRPNPAVVAQRSGSNPPSRMRTWDDIIAERRARGLTGPPVSTDDGGSGTRYAGSNRAIASAPRSPGAGQNFSSVKAK